MQDEEFRTNPQVYRILRVLKDNEESPTPDTKYGLNKEDIYRKIPGSKLTKVTYVRMLQEKGYILVKSMKDLEEKGLIDPDSVGRGEWNSQFVTTSAIGRELLKKVEEARGVNKSVETEISSSPGVKEVSNPPDYSEKINRNHARSVDRYAYGNKLIAHSLKKIVKKLEEPTSHDTMDNMNKTIDYIEKEMNSLAEFLDDENKAMFQKLSVSKYRAYDIEPPEIAILLEKKFQDSIKELSSRPIDGKVFLNGITSTISNRLKLEVPGVYEELKEDLDTLQDFHDLLFE